VWQAYSFRYYDERARSIRAEEQNAQVEKGRLVKRLEALGAVMDRPDTVAKLTEIDYLNNLIVRKHFSWTQVFANLEGVIPDNVHLVSVSPEVSKDKVKLLFEIQCRSISDESDFVRRLQASPVFEDVIVTHEERKGTGNASEIAVNLSVSYFPERVQ